MQKVDRLGWAVGFAFRSYGVRIGIRSNDPAALARVRELLPGVWETTESPIVDRVYSILSGGAGPRANLQRFGLLYGNHFQLARSMDRDSVFDAFESDLRIFLAEFAKHRVFVHAGVVGWKGRAIIIPGRSYSGKSTLVAELVRAGASYYSDEYAVLDGRGRVYPFSKPIELREKGQRKQAKVAITDLGGHPGTKPLTVGLVLMTQYQDGARWRPRKLTAGKAVLEMLFNTVSARRNPERALATLERVTAAAAVWKGVRGHATEVVPAMLRRLEDSVADGVVQT